MPRHAVDDERIVVGTARLLSQSADVLSCYAARWDGFSVATLEKKSIAEELRTKMQMRSMRLPTTCGGKVGRYDLALLILLQNEP